MKKGWEAGCSRVRERKGADQEGKRGVVFINRVTGGEGQGLGPMRTAVQLPRTQAMERDREVHLGVGQGDRRSRDHVTVLAK